LHAFYALINDCAQDGQNCAILGNFLSRENSFVDRQCVGLCQRLKKWADIGDFAAGRGRSRLVQPKDELTVSVAGFRFRFGSHHKV
jgi:hypothetical protein